MNKSYLILANMGGSKYGGLDVSSDNLSTKIQDHYSEKSKLKKENTKKGNIMAEKSCETKIQENRMMQHIHCRKSL